MAEINAKDLTAKTSPASTDSMLLFGTTSNEGAKITVDNLADNILGRLATKTFPNQVGGSSAATILAQLATLNSKIAQKKIVDIANIGTTSADTWFNTNIEIHTVKNAFIYVVTAYTNTYATAIGLNEITATASYEMKMSHLNAANGADSALFYAENKSDYKLWLKAKGINDNAFAIKIYVIGDPDATATIPS